MKDSFKMRERLKDFNTSENEKFILSPRILELTEINSAKWVMVLAVDFTNRANYLVNTFTPHSNPIKMFSL